MECVSPTVFFLFFFTDPQVIGQCRWDEAIDNWMNDLSSIAGPKSASTARRGRQILPSNNTLSVSITKLSKLQQCSLFR